MPTCGNQILRVAQYREGIRREQKGLKAALILLKQIYIYIYLVAVEAFAFKGKLDRNLDIL